MIKKPKFNLGKKTETIQMSNDFWVKKFDNGVKIRKKGQGELTLEVMDVFEMLLFLRKFGKRQAFPIFLTAVDMTYVWQKYPETKEFTEKLLMDEVTDDEKLKIHEDYMNKVKILEGLEDKK